ncbi:major facilitator superfamily domain-containing protein [Stachybotrys elegans]|uniref:Major facilitator superfamily domain-containing protein n=1 Tax=Stachybotrys elegans TaxID=80388 RepID=A0A8K0SZH2_9HYPO|nr:major facilitator superfamily domain-containing protein [Stachybotrys elegans]
MAPSKETDENGVAGSPERTQREASISTTHEERDAYRNDILRSMSHVSGHDTLQPAEEDPYYEAGDEIYEKLSARRKSIVVAILSFCAFLSPTSSTSVLSATPEVAAEYRTTGSIVNVSNAGYMVFMGLSPIVWGPVSQVFGRRPVAMGTAVAFFLLSVATALAPNLASFFVFRALSAFEGTAFILIGSTCIGDIYRPTERGTAIGWFMSGTLIGPALGPFLGGIIVTYSSWRSIFWLQTALAGVALLGIFFLVPETAHRKKIEDLEHLSKVEKAKEIARLVNPIRVLAWFRYPNLILVAAGSSALVWNMYSLLTPIRYVLNPRFQLETPMLSGLFYLAPGCGYILGTFLGGRWADMTVKRWIKKRGGVRIPEDRLRSTLPFLGILIPGCILVYGWAVDMEVGSIPVPVIAMFLQGVGQLFCFPSLNTYCLDVMPGLGAEVTAANFFVRYLAGCLGTAVVLPAIQGIGVGWFSTISTMLLVAGAVAVAASIRWGKEWREGIDAKRQAEHVARQRKHRQAQLQRAENTREMDQEAGVVAIDQEQEKRMGGVDVGGTQEADRTRRGEV